MPAFSKSEQSTDLALLMAQVSSKDQGQGCPLRQVLKRYLPKFNVWECTFWWASATMTDTDNLFVSSWTAAMRQKEPGHAQQQYLGLLDVLIRSGCEIISVRVEVSFCLVKDVSRRNSVLVNCTRHSPFFNPLFRPTSCCSGPLLFKTAQEK